MTTCQYPIKQTYLAVKTDRYIIWHKFRKIITT